LITGIGIDIVELERFGARLTPELIAELFLPDEIAYCRSQHHSQENFGARFAAKEAVFKALGAGLEQGLRWHDVEVCKEDSGAVHLSLTGKAAELASEKKVTKTFVSLSHTRQNAIAMVVLENRTASPEE
jgi:holo-[acyl-carrier protein] synthase